MKSPPKELAEWLNCKKCPLGERAKLHVLGRGVLPCDVLFIGEGPGRSEDVLGEAFVGPAGRLLDSALPEEYRDRRFFYTNLVACRPTDGVGQPNRAPQPEEIEACSPRLQETVRLAKAGGIVLCGRLPQQVLGDAHREIFGEMDPLRICFLPHPAALLRRGGSSAPDWPRYRKTLFDFFLRVLE